MKKLLLVLACLATLASAQVTPNIGLNIPPTGAQNWGVLMNQNFSSLDSLLSGNANVPGFKITGLLTIGITGSTQCLQVNASGQVGGFGISCQPTQTSGAPAGFCSGADLNVDITTGNLYTCTSNTWIKVNGGGGAANPGGSANQIQYNVGGVSFGGFTMGNDCTLVVATGAITCLRTNGTLFTGAATMPLPVTAANGGLGTNASAFSGVIKMTGGTGTALPLQGTDTNVLSSGTVSGTSANLCTDAQGGATTSGCPNATPSGTQGNVLVNNNNATGYMTSPAVIDVYGGHFSVGDMCDEINKASLGSTVAFVYDARGFQGNQTCTPTTTANTFVNMVSGSVLLLGNVTLKLGTSSRTNQGAGGAAGKTTTCGNLTMNTAAGGLNCVAAWVVPNKVRVIGISQIATVILADASNWVIRSGNVTAATNYGTGPGKYVHMTFNSLVGPNPVWQELAQPQTTTSSTADSNSGIFSLCKNGAPSGNGGCDAASTGSPSGTFVDFYNNVANTGSNGGTIKFGTPVIALGLDAIAAAQALAATDLPFSEGNNVKDLTIDCGGIEGCIGIQDVVSQDTTVVGPISIHNARLAGADFHAGGGSGYSNADILGIYVTHPSDTCRYGTLGIYLGNNKAATIGHLEVVNQGCLGNFTGYDPAGVPPQGEPLFGIIADGASAGNVINQLHVETSRKGFGVALNQPSVGPRIIGYKGHSTSTDCIYISNNFANGTSGVAVEDADNGAGSGCTNIVNDLINGNMVTAANNPTVPSYVLDSTGQASGLISTVDSGLTGIWSFNNILTFQSAGTNEVLVNSPTGAITATGPISSTSDGTHAGSIQLIGNTTVPGTLNANSVGFIGPPSASFTKYFLQIPSTAPSGSQVLLCGTPSTSVSTCSWAANGTGTVSVVGAGSLTSTALATGGGTTTVQTPSATSTLSSGGNMTLAGTLQANGACGAGTAGCVVLPQGSAQGHSTANTVTVEAPAAVTAYEELLPAAAGTGLLHMANSANVLTDTISGVAVADLTATGTPSGTTFLRGDNTWSVPPGSSTLSEDNITGSAAQHTLTETGVGHEITRAGVETANLTYPQVMQNTNTSSTTTGALGINTAGAGGTGQVPLIVNETVAAGDFADFYSLGTFTSGVFSTSGATKEFSFGASGNFGAAGSVSLGTPPTITSPGTGAYLFGTEGTEPSSIASGTTGFVTDSTSHCPVQWNNAVNMGCVKPTYTLQVATSDFTTASTSFVTITGLSKALPLVAATWSFECDLIVGQATAAVADQIGVQTATNGATNVAASGIWYTAAAVSTSAATTGNGSSTTAFSVVTATPGATGTKLPVHLAGTIEGASASGTTFNVTILSGSGSDTLTVYRGSECHVF